MRDKYCVDVWISSDDPEPIDSYIKASKHEREKVMDRLTREALREYPNAELVQVTLIGVQS